MRWPKKCACCDRLYTRQRWELLECKGIVDYGGGYVLDMRDCVCANTMAINVAEVQPCAN